jgi:CheY-like chemotaxis protein
VRVFTESFSTYSYDEGVQTTYSTSGDQLHVKLGAEQGARVLICEDGKDAAETLAAVLRLHGHEVLVCPDGQSAIAQAEKWRPTVAIIDIGLPGVTGYGVAQYIRRLPFGTSVLLIAITGYGTPADIEMARSAGFNWHFAKPAHPSFVLDTVENPKRERITRRDGIPLNPPS